MICVTIARGSHKNMVADHQKLADDQVQLVELRIDFINREPDVTALLKNRATPIIVTARRQEDGGLWRFGEDRRFRALREAILLGAEYVDIEEDIAKSIPRHGKTKRIISYHNMSETPDDLAEIWKRMAGCDPDIIKICTMPKSIEDVFRMTKLVRQANTKIPTIGICMGEMGQVTRILAGKFGSPFTYATFSEARIVAPGLMFYKTLRDVYNYDGINEETGVLGVVGDPVAHSLSPLIHNKSCQAADLNMVYLPFRVVPEDIELFIDRAPQWGVRGLSVTIPHKTAVLKKLTRFDPAVEEIGACNTIILDNFDRLGYNTDYKAALFSIETAMGGKVNDVSPIQGKNALVLGAGGAGKSLIYGFQLWGAKVAVADVDNARAAEVAEQFQCPFVEWHLRHGVKCQILANCTPVGMHPKTNETPFDKSGLHEGMVVFDAIYNPESTLLIKNARFKGCVPVTGTEMFVGQACLQFRHFTGKLGSVSLMRKILRNALSAIRVDD